MERSIHHYEVALGIASSPNWHISLFWIHFSLADLFFEEGRFDDAHAHIEHAKSHAINNPYNLARASLLQAGFWYQRHMFEEAKSEALRALDVFEKLRVTNDGELTRGLLGKMDSDLVTPDESADDGELLEIVILVACIISSCLNWVTRPEWRWRCSPRILWIYPSASHSNVSRPFEFPPLIPRSS